jgi:hypothetical protein
MLRLSYPSSNSLRQIKLGLLQDFAELELQGSKAGLERRDKTRPVRGSSRLQRRQPRRHERVYNRDVGGEIS